MGRQRSPPDSRFAPFEDMVMAPTPVGVAAAVIAALLSERAAGIWQLSGPRDISYAEIAAHIARRVGADLELLRPVAAASAGMPLAAISQTG
jgi:dTDP-4-dehydrorhamnose reductase